MGQWWGTAAALHPQAAGRLLAGPPQYSPQAPGDFCPSMDRRAIAPVQNLRIVPADIQEDAPDGQCDAGLLAANMAIDLEYIIVSAA